MKFEAGQTVTLYTEGAGVISKEKLAIEKIKDGLIYLEDSGKTFDLDGKCTEEDNFFGFEFWITHD